jgi:hypothetical protein
MKRILAWIRGHTTGIILAALFLAGLALRLWGISSVYQRVDDIPVAKQIYAVYQGYWSPDSFLFYPMFFCYVVGFLLRFISLALGFLGVHSGPGFYDFSLDQVLFIARSVSATMGGLTILTVFKIGKKLFSEKTGLAAAFFFSLSFIGILYGHQIVLDVPVTFFYALSLYFCVMVLKEGRWRHYLGAALFAGLAVATKYNGIFVILSILAAHIWKARESQKNVLKILLDRKIVASGLGTILAFIAGHPFALLYFRSFLKATKELVKLVHETEWYLVPIKPRTVVELITQNKWIKGLGNILGAEGIAFFLFILLGVIWVFYRRKKEEGFLSISALFYFLGALGFLGFSRWRDLAALALFYALFAALGLRLLARFLRRGLSGRVAFGMVTALLVLALGSRSLARSYYLWQNDTTQIAERWIRMNIPAGSLFGREWFTPEVHDPRSNLRFFTRPYLFWQDFPPFETFNFIEVSSASYGHFLRNKDFYPAQVELYSRLDRDHELLKDFYFREIEFKNPEVKIYSGRPGRRVKQRMELPALPPNASPAKEFVISDGTPYEKDINEFFLSAGATIERFFISRTKIGRLAVFVRGAESEGTLWVKNGWSRKTLAIRRGQDAFLIFEPHLSFPYDRYCYRLKLWASDGLKPCLVRICYDDFAIGLELYRSREFEAARESFERALEARRPATLDTEIYLYLASCAKKTGRPEDERRYREMFLDAPGYPRFASFYESLKAGGPWTRRFEKYSGIDIPLFESIQSVVIEGDEFAFEKSAAPGSGSLDSRARLPSTEAKDGPDRLSPEKAFPPQAYFAELVFSSRERIVGSVGNLEILLIKTGGTETAEYPLIFEPAGSDRQYRAAVPFEIASVGERVRFRLKLRPGSDVTLNYLRVKPDLKSFLSKKYAGFEDYPMAAGR